MKITDEKYVCPECGYAIIEAPGNIIDSVILGTGVDTKFTCTGCGKEGIVAELLKINYSKQQPLKVK